MNVDIIVYQQLEDAGFDKNQIKAQCALVQSYVDSKYDNLVTKECIKTELEPIKSDIRELKSDIKYLTYFMAATFAICAVPLLSKAWSYLMSLWGVQF